MIGMLGSQTPQEKTNACREMERTLRTASYHSEARLMTSGRHSEECHNYTENGSVVTRKENNNE